MSSLGEFHHVEERPTKASKIIAGVVIALILGIAAVYAVTSGMFSSQPGQTTQSYPRGL